MNNIYCVGDCFTQGIGAKKDFGYPEQLGDMFQKCGVRVFNLGRTKLEINHILGYLDLYNKKIKDSSIVCVWIGTNDIVHKKEVDETIIKYIHLCDNFKYRNNKVVVFTLTPWIENHLYPPVGYEKKRQNFNSILRNNYNIFSDAIVDVGGNAIVGKEGSSKDMKYYDRLETNHFNQTGYELVAGMVYDSVSKIIDRDFYGQ